MEECSIRSLVEERGKDRDSIVIIYDLGETDTRRTYDKEKGLHTCICQSSRSRFSVDVLSNPSFCHIYAGQTGTDLIINILKIYPQKENGKKQLCQTSSRS